MGRAFKYHVEDRKQAVQLVKKRVSQNLVLLIGLMVSSTSLGGSIKWLKIPYEFNHLRMPNKAEIKYEYVVRDSLYFQLPYHLDTLSLVHIHSTFDDEYNSYL